MDGMCTGRRVGGADEAARGATCAPLVEGPGCAAVAALFGLCRRHGGGVVLSSRTRLLLRIIRLRTDAVMTRNCLFRPNRGCQSVKCEDNEKLGSVWPEEHCPDQAGPAILQGRAKMR